MDSEGLGRLRLVDNGVIRAASEQMPGMPVIHAYHLIPSGASKARGVARHMQIRGYAPEDCIAAGDSREDMEAASVVGTFWLVANALERDLTLGAGGGWPARSPDRLGELRRGRLRSGGDDARRTARSLIARHLALGRVDHPSGAPDVVLTSAASAGSARRHRPQPTQPLDQLGGEMLDSKSLTLTRSRNMMGGSASSADLSAVTMI